ncbi:MAG: hypothetical protein JWN23_2519 [Rhodocyclales bacterium]|nr:hypothetical protein [Rhodocyclales bacterium]
MNTSSTSAGLVDVPPAFSMAAIREIGGDSSHADGMRGKIVAAMQQMQAAALADADGKGGPSRFLARALRDYFFGSSKQAEAFLKQFSQMSDEAPQLLALVRGLLSGGLDAQAMLQYAMEMAGQGEYADIAAELLLILFKNGALNAAEDGLKSVVALLDNTPRRAETVQRLLDLHRKSSPQSSAANLLNAAQLQEQIQAAQRIPIGRRTFQFDEMPLSSPAVQGWLKQGLLPSRSGLSGGPLAEYKLRHARLMPTLFGYVDKSFVISEAGRPLYYCEMTCGYCIDNTAWVLNPFRVDEDAPPLEDMVPAILRNAEPRVLLQRGNALTITLDDSVCPPLPFLMNNYAAMLCYGMEVELDQPEEALWKAVRKSYKPIVSKVLAQSTLCHFNAGQRELTVDDVHLDAKTLEDVLLYLGNMDSNQLLFSRDMIGCYRDWIDEYGGEIGLVWHKTYGPIAASIITDYHGLSTYCWGRSMGPVLDPLTRTSHLSLWDAIKRSRARGNKTFSLGSFDASGTQARKSNDISKFKHGFATRTQRMIEWSKVLC